MRIYFPIILQYLFSRHFHQCSKFHPNRSSTHYRPGGGNASTLHQRKAFSNLRGGAKFSNSHLV